MVVRYKDPNGDGKKYIVRILEPFEYFRLHGWDDSHWIPVPPSEGRDPHFLELLANLAGNSYSLFSLRPMVHRHIVHMGKIWFAPSQLGFCGGAE